MARHLTLVHSADEHIGAAAGLDASTSQIGQDTNVVDLGAERRRRRQRYHPSAGRAWLDEMFDDDLDPVC